METKVLEIENLKEQILELQHENFLLTFKNADLEKQNAILQDKLEFASEQADTFAKALKKVYDEIENIIDDLSENNCIGGIDSDLKKIKNSIPENAIRRAE